MPRSARFRPSLTIAALLGALAILLLPAASAGAAETATPAPSLATLDEPQVTAEGSVVNHPPSYVPSRAEEEKAPTVTITKGPLPLGNENRPTFEFVADGPVAFTCQVDGGTPQDCASPYLVPSVLGEGTHGFVVTATDARGRQASSAVYGFTIDTRAPKTTIVGHPNKVVETTKKAISAMFRLKASESPVTFYCQIDKEPLRICSRSFSHLFSKGKHALRVRAKDEAGNLAEKQTVFHFRIKQISSKPRRN
jgi:hypothetical protein